MAGDDDLFDSSSDGGDTDELINASKANTKPVATKKKSGGKKLQEKSASAPKKRKVPDADFDSDSDDDSDDEKDDTAGLFDSDDSDDDESPKKKLKKKKKRKKKRSRKSGGDNDGGSGRKLSKKERMEALRNKKRQQTSQVEGAASTPAVDALPEGVEGRKKKKKRSSEGGGLDKGYDSGDSYDSVTFERTKEDDDFIDAEGEDPDALKELYAEQHFDDERPESESEDEGKKQKGKKGGKKSRRKGPDALSDDDLEGDEEPTNPIMAAVKKMKKKKKEPKKLSELEAAAKNFVEAMETAAYQDEEEIKERRPATKKLAMLPQVLEMLADREMMRPLLDFDLLVVCKRWIQPLSSGALGNVTVRQRLLDAISKMTGEKGVSNHDLKRSSFGKVVMSLYMHKSETPAMKRQHKALIEQWSRPIFQKSGNMRDLERVQANRTGGIGAIARAQAQAQAQSQGGVSAATSGRDEHDLTSIISGKSKGTRDLGNNRVRVPFSKGFQFSVRPDNKAGDAAEKRSTARGKIKEGRDTLHKRMLEKNRPVAKNSRSSSLSVEGRPVK